MDTRSYTRLSLCLLVASFAAGCGPLRGFRSNSTLPTDPGPSGRIPADSTPPAQAQPEAFSGGTVVGAGGANGMPGAQPPAGQGGGAAPALPQPRPLPQGPLPLDPNWPQGAPRPVAGQPPLPPGSLGPPASPYADPHLRANPTVTGNRLNLAPNEVPADRVIALSQQLDALLGQNAVLLARIKELEGIGVSREQALAEAMREVESITAAAARDRAALQGQIADLQGRIRQLEEEDIVFLRAVIDALGRLLEEKKP